MPESTWAKRVLCKDSQQAQLIGAAWTTMIKLLEDNDVIEAGDLCVEWGEDDEVGHFVELWQRHNTEDFAEVDVEEMIENSEVY